MTENYDELPSLSPNSVIQTVSLLPLPLSFLTILPCYTARNMDFRTRVQQVRYGPPFEPLQQISNTEKILNSFMTIYQEDGKLANCKEDNPLL